MASITQPAYATGTIVSDGTVPTADDEVVVGGVTYVFKASVTTGANEVEIEATAAGTMQNLYDAINGTITEGVGSETVANPDVLAVSVDETTVTVKSRVPGTVGNLIPLTESGTHTSIGDSETTLVGGTGSIATVIAQLLDTAQLNAEVEQFLRSVDGNPSAN